jgi:hypothetical protein
MLTKNKQKDEDTEVHADQWNTMTLQQLNNERDKVVRKLSMLHGLLGTMPSAIGLYKALEHAQTILDQMITDRTQK